MIKQMCFQPDLNSQLKIMDIKRTLLWAIFAMSLIMIWDNWQRHEGKPSLFAPKSINQAVAPTGSVNDSSIPVVKGVEKNEVASETSEKLSENAKNIDVTTDVIKAQFSTQGAELRSLELLKHMDTLHPEKNIHLFEMNKDRVYLAQTGLVGGNGISLPNHKSLMHISSEKFELQPDQNTLEVKFESDEIGGVKLIKTFVFKKGRYDIDVRHEIVNVGSQPVQPSLYLQLVRDGNKLESASRFYSTFTGPAAYNSEEHFKKIEFSDIEKGKSLELGKADNGWIALVQHYFVSAFIPKQSLQREVFTKKISDNLYSIGTIIPLVQLEPGATTTIDANLFSGPQEESALEETAPGLELVKDYGWLTIIAKPLFWLLDKIHGFVGNWGWSIIVLTILIKLMFFPLSAASYKSMAKMKLVTPKMQKIKEQYAKDPAKMNQAMMELYKTEKVNPLGGCLPIVIQIPVFISLYWVLLASVEMRNAPWLGWIKDLSTPDPFFILPVIMAATMFLQTKLNPTPPDPMQAKMMMVMPLVFSVMFFFFPSGLVLYYVVNNTLSIAQQWQINKLFGEKKTA